MVQELVHKVRAGPPPEPHTLAAHLFSVKDPFTGGPLPEDHLISEVGIFFLAGFETTGESRLSSSPIVCRDVVHMLAHPHAQECHLAAHVLIIKRHHSCKTQRPPPF